MNRTEEAVATNERPVPKWVLDSLNKWCVLLHLQSWEVRASLDPRPNDDEYCQACVGIYPNVLKAELTIRDDVPEELTAVPVKKAVDWQKVIIHELLHVFIGRITDYIHRDIFPELSPSARRIAEATLEREVEPVVELMAHILQTMEKSDEQENDDGSNGRADDFPDSWAV